jgi:anti-anti-sigma factor
MDHVPALALQGELTISQAAALHAQLLEAVAAGVQQLDLGGITECDSAGVQLLLAARHSVAARQGRTLRLAPVSEPVRATLQRYGLQGLAD